MTFGTGVRHFCRTLFMLFFKNQQTGGALLKRIFAFFLSLLLILGICPMSALADTGGSGNVDGGGGSMGQGTSQNSDRKSVV